MEPAWQGGFPIQSPALGTPFDAGQNHEDWEAWLRWDPNTLEPSSPEDGTVNSGSSKNDSPIQNNVLPVDGPLFGKNDTLAPPMILGEDAMDFQEPSLVDNDPFLFGAGIADFDFQSTIPLDQLQPPIPKIDTNIAPWPLTSGADDYGINLSVLSNDNVQTLPSVATNSTAPSSMHHSPESTAQHGTSMSPTSPNPPPKKRGRKRKIDIEQERRESNGESQEDGDGDEPPEKKTSHNVIEKRYRNNLNDKIVELRNAVPSLRAMGRANRGDDTEDLGGLTPAHKLNKATVMAKATEYIRHLEKRNKVMSDEMETLKSRLAAVETAIGRTRERQASVGNTSSVAANGRPRQISSSSSSTSASQTAAQNFLNVPQEQTRMNQQVVQPQYLQQQQQPTYARQPAPPVDAQNQPQHANARRGGGVMNKVMVGAMAGMMVMEGFSAESQPGDDGSSRGLFALPTQLFERGVDEAGSPAAVLPRPAAIQLLRMCLVVGALLYLLAPLFSFSQRRKQKPRTPVIRLPPAPSLASPISVRRKAWLTAIQTVWVPKHFLLEVVAVTLKMISLSLRRLIGSEAFNSLTGANKEDETARIKAWDIAIDAQLAGGDQEVSYYRLLLTLMESGTLPDSPARLMQKAVHFRVFFWEVANAGYGNLIGFKQFTEKVGKYYWDLARRQQKDLVHAKAQGRPVEDDDAEVDMLPDHLARLVELDCDDVLSDEMIQRAWNLAWNKPSAYRTAANEARDAVVEDHAIRSPLDAVAAWYANMTVDETLAISLSESASTLDTEYYIGLAVSVAPSASATLARALTAKAILSSTNRDANILAALDALPADAAASSPSELNVVSHIPASPDVRTALTIAKLLALLSPHRAASEALRAQTQALDTVARLHLPPSSFTLLTAVAAFRLLKSLAAIRRLPVYAASGLENLAASLRIWVSTAALLAAGPAGKAGSSSSSPFMPALGLGDEVCSRMVGLCLDVAKRVGGWDDRDSGYGSAGTGSPVAEETGTLFRSGV